MAMLNNQRISHFHTHKKLGWHPRQQLAATSITGAYPVRATWCSGLHGHWADVIDLMGSSSYSPLRDVKTYDPLVNIQKAIENGHL